MADLQSTNINGNLYIGTTQNLTEAGYIWYDTTDNKVYYSADSGSTVVRKELGNSLPTADAPPPPYTLGLSPALISVSAQNNATWTQRTADISSYIGATARLVIRYNSTTSFTADLQLDDFDIGGNTYDPETSTHSFETSWSSAERLNTNYNLVTFTSVGTGTSGYRFNRHASGTPSGSTGNISGNTGNYYFYAETSVSHPTYYWLRSPSVTITTGTLSFYSAQNGATCGPFEAYLDVIS